MNQTIRSPAQTEEPVSVGFFGGLTKYIDNVTIFVLRIFEWNSLILLLLIIYEVIMRYFFNHPTIWGLDSQIYLSAAGRVIGFGYATMIHSHVTMDILTVNLSFKKSKALELFNYIIFYMPLILCITWTTFQRAMFALKKGEKYYSTWRPPLSPIIIFIVGAYILLILQVIAESIKCVIHLQRGSDSWLKQR